MKVLVTGASGFIAQYVIEQLTSLNYEVIATSRDVCKVKGRDWYSKVTFVEADIRFTNENLFEKFLHPDFIIHLAWDALDDFKSTKHIDEILPIHCAFLKNLVKNGAQQLMVTGTCLEYGMQSGVLEESMATSPTLPYAIAKDTLRSYLTCLAEEHPVHVRWGRLFYMYGRGQSPSSLVSLLETAIKRGDRVFNMSRGEQLRDFSRVEDVAEKIVKIGTNTTASGVFNCCSGTPISVRRLAEKIKSENNSNIELNLGYYDYPSYEPLAFWGCSQKTNKLLKV